mgnify:FL=1|jgi:hypothetical protein
MSRIRANNITNGAGTGAPTFPHGAVINGIATITSDVSSFSNLSVNKVSLGTGTTLSGEDNNVLKILTNGSERVTVSAGGSVGIGTTQPVYTLNISNDGLSGMQLGVGTHSYRVRANVSSSDDLGFFIEDNEGSDLYTIRGKDSTNNPNLHRWYTNTTGVTSERLRIGPEGQIGLSGNNYGNDNQVLTSTGNAAAPEWRGVNTAFFGKQDTAHSIPTATWTTIKNLGVSPVNIDGWNESNGLFTVQEGQAGTWFFTGSAGIDDIQASDYVNAGISKNGEDPVWYVHTRADDAASQRVVSAPAVTGILTAAVGDTFSLRVFHNEGSSEPTEQNRCWFGGFRLSV